METLFLDQEKAFDRVSWKALHHLSLHLGLGPVMLRNISTLYNPSNPLRRRVQCNDADTGSAYAGS